MVLPFLKKGGTEVIAGRGFAPADRVRELAGRGFSEPEMIDVLRRDGFSPEEIDRALTEALKSSVAAGPTNAPVEQQPTFQQPAQQMPTMEDISPQVPESSLPEGYYQPQVPTEEYIDSLIQARLSEVGYRLDDFSVRYQELQKRFEAVQLQLNELTRVSNLIQQQIISKIDGFGESVEGTNSRIGSLEKAFKETLPSLIEAVRDLSDLVQRFKKEA